MNKIVVNEIKRCIKTRSMSVAMALHELQRYGNYTEKEALILIKEWEQR